MTIQRKPPFDAQAEMGVLGSLMLLPKAFAEVEAIISPSDFYDDANGKIFKAMQAIVASGKPLDVMLLRNRAQANGDLEALGGEAHLAKVVNCVPNAANLTYYAEIVAAKSLARRVIAEATLLLKDAYDDRSDAADLVTQFENASARLASRASVAGLPKPISESARLLIDRLKQPEHLSSTRTFFGVRKIDEALGPALGGEVCIVAARTSMGKTSLVQGVLRNSAIKGNPSLLVSLEMQDTEIASRECSRATEIDSKKIRNNTLSMGDLTRLDEAQQSFVGLPFYTWSPARATFADIRSYVIHARGKLGIKAVGIDYIGLIAEPAKFRSDRREHLAQVSRGLKQLAKELDMPLFVLCQLNREAEDERPTMRMLRECGAIEEDADMVLAIYQDKEDGDEHRHLAVLKFRAGAIGDMRLGWDGSRFEFTDPNNEWRG